MKSIEEMIKELTPIEKVQTLISMIENIPRGIILLAQSLKEDYPPHPPNKNKYKYSNNP